MLPGPVPLAIPPYKQSPLQPRVYHPTPTAVKPRPARSHPRSPLTRHRFPALLPGCGVPPWSRSPLARHRFPDLLPGAVCRGGRARRCRGIATGVAMAVASTHLVGRTVLGAPLPPGVAHTCRSRTNRRGRRPRRPLRPGLRATSPNGAPAAPPRPHFTTLHRGNISQTSPKHRFLSGY